MDKEDIIFRKRMEDLASMAYRNYYYEASDFLNEREQSIVKNMADSGAFAGVQVLYDGGYEHATRQVVIFTNEDGLVPVNDYPITALEIRPKAVRFADVLTHRDVLGALMHLGINRNQIGDILMNPNDSDSKKLSSVILFCKTGLYKYIQEELQQIRKTMVTVKEIALQDIHYVPSFIEMNVVVSSLRIDAVFSTVLKCSRNTFKTMVQSGNIYLNHRELYSGSTILKNDDVISIRGYGKYRFTKCIRETRKSRLLVSVEKYN